MATQNGIPFGVGTVRVFSGRETVEDLFDIIDNVYPWMEGEIARAGLDPVCEVRLTAGVVDSLLVEKGEGYEPTPALEALGERLAERRLLAVGIASPMKGGASREALIARNGITWAHEGKFEAMRKGLHLLPYLHNGRVPYVFVQQLAGIMRREIEGREAELNPIIAKNVARVAAELYRLSEGVWKEAGAGVGSDPGAEFDVCDRGGGFLGKLPDGGGEGGASRGTRSGPRRGRGGSANARADPPGRRAHTDVFCRSG